MVRAAAAAGWWVILIAMRCISLYGRLPRRHDHSACMVAYDVGQAEVNWAVVQTVSLWFMGVFKMFAWLLFLVVLRMTLWARQLQKVDRQGTK
jgi:hypothetical protein